MKLVEVKLYRHNKYVATVSWREVAEFTGLSKSAAGDRLRESNDYDTVMRIRGCHGYRRFILECGREITIAELVRESGVGRNTLYARLYKAKERNYERLIRSAKKIDWVSEEEIIVGGFVLNPAYLDGVTHRSETIGVYATDRDGKAMTGGQRGALMRFRTASRNQWLRDKSEAS